VMIVVPTATISWTRRPCRLLRCAASFRSRVALRRRVARYRLLCFHFKRCFPRFLIRPKSIVVLRVIRSELPIHLTLETANGPGIRSQLSAQNLQAGGALSWHDGNGGGPQVQSNGSVAHRVLRLVIRDALQDQLDEVPLARLIGPLGTWAAG